MADSIRFLSSFYYLLCFYLLFFSFYSYKSCVYGARELANHHHVNKKKSHMPAPSSCSASTKGLQIAHRYGPCSPLGQANPPPTSREILLQDQFRVRSLNAISSNDESGIGAELPLQGGSLGAGNFVVKVGFGTPKRDLTLMFDTGSYMTWIQCEPCTSCYDQAETIFDPSKSSTFSQPSCVTPTCPPYSILYHDKSYSSGVYAKDTLTISSDNVFPGFVFGCGQNNSDDFGGVAGVLGVGQGDTSIMSQTLGDFGQEFCYCLPLSETSTGYLRFGYQAFKTCQSEISVPLITDSTRSKNYFVNLVGITIGQNRLEMSSNVGLGSSPSTIIDSGTIISRLPGSVYSQLQSAFQDSMSKYPTAKPLPPMDTCYDLSGNDGDINSIVPSMILHFDGSKDLKLEPSAVAFKDSHSQTVCLAFAKNKNSDDLTIIGNHQQRNLKIYYSVLTKQVAFSTGGCGN